MSLVPKLLKTAAAHGRFMPNLGGQNATYPCLYTSVMSFMAFYGAPVWADILMAKTIALLRKLQRSLRITRGYQTISCEAACVMAGSPPEDREARALASINLCPRAEDLGK
ncbi:hypothetical protein EVAR_52069_1 [Eumeta japonica]|uniref:Reverse transcriptase domain-containing protein n=1 Tax=Eumeta variegata TaxID=151549 RepID=A0A4C1Y412_EUMVA|nr:hypothetical protein EVAR_52069_1 [Eumeta japonica]